MLTRDVTRGYHLLKTCNCHGGEGAIKSPVTCPISISGYCTICNPSLAVLILAVILILTATVLLSRTLRARIEASSLPAAESDEDEGFHNLN